VELNPLSDHGESTKKEVVNIVGEDSINDSDSVQVRKLGLSLAGSLGEGSSSESWENSRSSGRRTCHHSNPKASIMVFMPCIIQRGFFDI
jgi:hypothetical protein